jgi:hypothetical protein
VAPIDEGRSSAAVFSLKSTRAGDYVVKVLPRQSWWSEMSGVGCVEAELWTSGITKTLPPPLACPTIDLAFNAARGEYFMLMDDVSAAIIPRGTFDERRVLWLFDGLARMHARYWQSDALGGLPVWSMTRRVRFLRWYRRRGLGRQSSRPTSSPSHSNGAGFRWFIPTFSTASAPTVPTST